MKKRIVLLTMALLMVLPMNAFALEVPTETVVQNLNGSQPDGQDLYHRSR